MFQELAGIIVAAEGPKSEAVNPILSSYKLQVQVNFESHSLPIELMAPTLASEIIDHVIDHLHADTHALLACARVHSTFLNSVRFHLYTSVVLNDIITCSLLRHTIFLNPSLIPFIRYLFVEQEPVFASFYTIFKDVSFTHLRNFECVGIQPTSVPRLEQIMSSSMPRLIFMGLQDCFSLHITVLNQLFKSAPRSLKGVELRRVFATPDGQIAQVMGHPRVTPVGEPCRIETLVLGHSNVFDWLFHSKCSLDFRKLTELELVRDFQMLETLLPHCSSTLEHLSITTSMG